MPNIFINKEPFKHFSPVEGEMHVWLTSGFGPGGEVSALNGDAEQSVGAGAVLVHLSAEGDPVPSRCR